MKHTQQSYVTFEHGLGKTSSTYIKDLFVECCDGKKLFNLAHFIRNAWTLRTSTTTWHGYMRLIWSLYLKKHVWDTALPYHISDAYTMLQNLYNTHHPATMLIHKQYTIPPIIHQIWLGSPFPSHYRAWQQTWQQIPGWHYRLWTDADVPSLQLHNQDLYNRARNWGERADIIRYEILYRYGGLYVDTDFVCLKPDVFEQFHHQYDFYSSLQPLDIMMFCFANGVIGTAPQHPILKAVIEHLAVNNKNSQSPVWAKTGPVPFTKMAYHQLTTSGKNAIIFPPEYFFPRTLLDEREEQAWPATSIAVHHWAASWNKPRACIK